MLDDQDFTSNGQQESPARPLLLHVSDVALMLGLGRSKTYEMISTGELPALRFGRAVRVPLKALQERIDSMTMAPCN